MTRHILLLLLFFLTGLWQGQAATLDVALAVKNAAWGPGSNVGHVLKGKMKEATTIAGLRPSEAGSLALVVSFDVAHSETIEGGMRNILTHDVALNLDLQQPDGLSFGATTLNIEGHGYSDDETFVSALTTLRADDQRLQDFLKKTAKAVVAYYAENLSSTISRANAMAERGDYEEALFTLSAVPTAVRNYSLVEAAQTSIFYTIRQRDAAITLQAARRALAVEDYETAAALAAEVDPQSEKAAEAQALLNRVAEAQAEAHRRAEIAQEREHAEEQAREIREANIRRQKIAEDGKTSRTLLRAMRDVAAQYAKRNVSFYWLW